ncbi:MAG TPA: DMT family transporter [Burkholderiales bacterium]|nr:DMT family transporter [Burkholderiales bacterium]
MNGYCAAALAVLIWAAYPVATRAGVTGSFSAEELVTLRFGIGALLFLPYLLMHVRAISRKAWLRGVTLTLFQGAGMGALVIFGLRFAPANHQAALGPGVCSTWVALLGFLVFARRPSTRIVVGATLCAIGVVVLSGWGPGKHDTAVLAGDAMFLAASALGALYVLQLRSWGVSAMQAAAIVTVYSGLVVVPWHLWCAPGPLWHVAPVELLWQTLWQGVLIGCVALIAFNHAIARLGAERSSAMIALVPVLSAMLALIFLGEVPSTAEVAAILAISAGVSISASLSGQSGLDERVDEAAGLRAVAARIARF